MFRRTALLSLGLLAPARALLVSSIKQPVARRGVLAAGAATFAAVPPAFADKKPVSDGKWAQRYEAFEDEEFEDFSTTPSGLMYKIIEEGYGVKPLAGQKIKVRMPIAAARLRARQRVARARATRTLSNYPRHRCRV